MAAIREHDIQNEIRLALAADAVMMRANAGKFWTGQRIWDQRRQEPILINIRPIIGMPKGTSDLIGFRRSDGRFVAIEVKTKTGRLTEEQKRFLKLASECGCIAGVARSAKEALEILNGSTLFKL